jgi:hypothetical protein
MTLPRLRLLLPFFVSLLSAQTANLSGTWVLNVEKSKWGSKDKPVSGEVIVQHNEPAFNYSGWVSGENGTRNSFEFKGAIDGKEHPLTGGDVGEGKITIRRVNPKVIEGTAKSNDGSITEITRTQISADGKMLTRDIDLRGPAGHKKWTEVYERK